MSWLQKKKDLREYFDIDKLKTAFQFMHHT